MARVYDLACDVAKLREEYVGIHQRVFALRFPVFFGARRDDEDYGELLQRLAGLEAQLCDIASQVKALSHEDLARRGSPQIQAALSSYVPALAESVARLETICQHLDQEQRDPAGASHYSSTELRQDKIGYDDAVQEYRRHGARLQELFQQF